MRADGRVVLAALAVAAVLLAAAGIAAAAKPGPPSKPGTASFEMTGSVDGLLPTLASTLQLKVENPHAFAINVVEVTVTSDDPAGACRASDLAVGPIPVPFDVPATGERVVPVEVSLAADVENACQGTTWSLRYTGVAERLR